VSSASAGQVRNASEISGSSVEGLPSQGELWSLVFSDTEYLKEYTNA